MWWRAALACAAALVLVAGLGLTGYEQGLSTLSISQTIEPTRIFIKGSAVSPETATVTLTLQAPRPPERLPADVILVVDRSASFELAQAVSAAERLIDALGPDDRVGLVSFATEATLDAPLTPAPRAGSVRAALNGLVTEGKTGLGEGIALAVDELVFSGREEAALIAMLLTDGRANFGRDPLAAARTAAEEGVTIHAVGIGRFPDRDLLTEIAETTGGQFFGAFTDAIASQILRLTLPEGEPVATEIEVEETLADGIDFETAFRNRPARVTAHPDGTTTLRWELDALRPNETWTAQYTVSGSEAGTFALHRFPSAVRYLDFRGREIERELPQLTLTVEPEPPKPKADFRFAPENPTRFDEVEFIDASTVGRGGTIVRWLWRFGDGATSTAQNPTHRYAEDGTYRVTLTITTAKGVEDLAEKTVKVVTPPQTVDAAFRVMPENPTRFDEVQFTDESVVEPRGEITHRLWDFGDGTTSTAADPTHRYAQDGTYRVTLTVTSDEGVEATATRKITVFTPMVSARRTIDAFIPPDEILPGRMFRVTVQITVNVRMNGLGLDENLPVGWQVKTIDDSTARMRAEDLQWLFFETLEPGTRKTIVYEVTVPEDAKAGTYQVDGAISSASPQMNVAVEGDTQIKILTGFPVRIVLAHWNTSTQTLDLQGFPEHIINKNQILQAIAWWKEGIKVPFTENEDNQKKAIDFNTVQTLVAYWLTDTSVFEELPKPDAQKQDTDTDEE